MKSSAVSTLERTSGLLIQSFAEGIPLSVLSIPDPASGRWGSAIKAPDFHACELLTAKRC
jgi:hypothetical protein